MTLTAEEIAAKYPKDILEMALRILELKQNGNTNEMQEAYL